MNPVIILYLQNRSITFPSHSLHTSSPSHLPPHIPLMLPPHIPPSHFPPHTLLILPGTGARVLPVPVPGGVSPWRRTFLLLPLVPGGLQERCVCVCACVRACVRACVCACVCVICVCVSISLSNLFTLFPS